MHPHLPVPGKAVHGMQGSAWRMEENMDARWVYEVGDIVKLKKPHPCGSHEWEILRVGADFRLSCMGCAHHVMMERRIVEKNARALTKKAPAQ